MSTSPESVPLRQVQRVAAYAVLRRGDGVLLVRASPTSVFAGRWALPGGGLRHGEPPREAVARSVRAETGLAVAVGGVIEATSDVVDLPREGLRLHTLRLLYDVTTDAPPRRGHWGPPAGDTVLDGGLPRRAGVDRAEFVTPDDAAERPLMPYAARLLGLASPDVAPGAGASPALPETPRGIVAGEARQLRVSAYALIVEDSSLLLTRLSGGSRRWTLPGGGIDFGEDPLAGVRREVHEEAGMPLTPGRLLEVDSIHFTGRSWSGRIEDQHAVRLVYAGAVPAGLTPRVVEVDGSTEAAAWIPLADVHETPHTDLVDVGLRHL